MPTNLNLRTAFFAAFILIELCLLAWWLLRLDGRYDNEAFLLFQMLLVIVGFPVTLVAVALIALVDVVVPVYAGHTRSAAFAIWLVLALAAYLQWFVWTPMLLQRVRSWWRRRSKA